MNNDAASYDYISSIMARDRIWIGAPIVLYYGNV